MLLFFRFLIPQIATPEDISLAKALKGAQLTCFTRPLSPIQAAVLKFYERLCVDLPDGDGEIEVSQTEVVEVALIVRAFVKNNVARSRPSCRRGSIWSTLRRTWWRSGCAD
jgi:hypothetical protein